MGDIIQVREPEKFHRRVLELEKDVWQRETYRVMAEMDPETDKVIHVVSETEYILRVQRKPDGVSHATPLSGARTVPNSVRQ